MIIGHPFLEKLGPSGTDSPRFGMGQDCLWERTGCGMVLMSVRRLYVLCLIPVKFITSGCGGDLWSRKSFLILACGTSTALQQHFNGTSIALQQQENFFFIFFLSVLLSALVKRVSVSRMQDCHQTPNTRHLEVAMSAWTNYGRIMSPLHDIYLRPLIGPQVT